MKHPPVSVIIPVYNVATYLDETLQSVARQDYPNIEIIVVDDGSRPDAASTITAICTAYDNLTLLHQKNQGQAAAREAGLHKAKGEYIWFLDADDRLAAGAIRRLVTLLEAHPEAVAAYGPKNLIFRSGLPHADFLLPDEKNAISGDILPALLSGVALMTPNNVCMRAQTARAIKYPHGMRQGEDWVMFCRMAIQGDVLYAPDEIIVEYRIHDGNVSSKVFDSPHVLFDMLDTVFKDPAFIAHIGKEKLATYYQKHVTDIRRHLREGLQAKGEFRKAKRYSAHRFPRLKAMMDTLVQPVELKRDDTGRQRILHIGHRIEFNRKTPALLNLLEHHDPSRTEHLLLDYAPETYRMRREMKGWNIHYHTLNCRRDTLTTWDKWRLAGFIRLCEADVVHLWEDTLPAAACRAIERAGLPVIWSPRTPEAELPRLRSASLERLTDQRFPTPVDTGYYRPNPAGRHAVREELGLTHSDTILIGMTDDLDKAARHIYFLRAAKMFLQHHPNAYFLLSGEQVFRDNAYLSKLLKFLQLEERVFLLGPRWDMADICSALDIHTHCPSDPIPNHRAWQAVACGTPCITGDRRITAAQGNAVTPLPLSDDAGILCAAWQSILALPEQTRHAMSQQGSEYVRTHLSLEASATALENLYRRAATK